MLVASRRRGSTVTKTPTTGLVRTIYQSITLIGTGGGGGGSGLTAQVSWTAPSEANDGSAASISGYKIYVGSGDANLTSYVQVGAGTTSYTFTNLSAGTYYFAVAAIDSNGVEGDLSDYITKVVS